MNRSLILVGAVLAALALPAAAQAGGPCSGSPSKVRPITLSVEGQSATGAYTLPAGRPRGLVVFGHGAANTVSAWTDHLRAVAAREGFIAVAMNYRGMIVTGIHATRGTETARGWPAEAGGEDLVAAAQHFDRLCPDLPGVVLYGVSMGGNMTGLAAAARAQRSDGRPLFDYWIAVEGVHNFTESYFEARLVAPQVKFAAAVREDIEAETGGPFETHAAEYVRRTNVARIGDIAGAGLRGVVLVHAFEDGIAPYNQSVEMANGLRGAGVPTDFYSVGRAGSPDDAGDTIGKYGGVATGMAGHGWEGSKTHVVIQTGFDRLSALVSRGEPAPCNRDFVVHEHPSNVSPDPREAPDSCGPAAFPPAGEPRGCEPAMAPRAGAPSVRRRGRRVVLTGRAAAPGCARVRRVMVAVARRQGDGRCRPVLRGGRLGERRSCRKLAFLRAEGRGAWRLAPARRLRPGRYLVRVLAVSTAGRRSAMARGSFRIR